MILGVGVFDQFLRALCHGGLKRLTARETEQGLLKLRAFSLSEQRYVVLCDFAPNRADYKTHPARPLGQIEGNYLSGLAGCSAHILSDRGKKKRSSVAR